MNNNIKALIVDDEIEACENLNRILSELDSSIEIIGHANSTKEAEIMIANNKPDLLFLDIEMPNENGIDFLKRISPIQFETVFVTAFDDYAIKAFKLNALDYVLKPLKKDYLEKTLKRVKEFLFLKDAKASPVTELLRAAKEESKKRLTLRNGADIHYLDFDDIALLSAEGSYTTIVLNNKTKSYVSSYALGHYEDILPPNFTRVHRSHIINSDQIKCVKAADRNHFIVLRNDMEIPISRRRYKSFKENTTNS